MDAPAAVPEPVKSMLRPSTAQPGKVFRVSVTTTAVVNPVALLPLTTSGTVSLVSIVRVNAPVRGTGTDRGIVPETTFGCTVSNSVAKAPVEALGSAGVNTASTSTVPVAANDGVVVVATPLESRAKGGPMALPPIWNWTEPAGMAAPAGGVTVAINVTG